MARGTAKAATHAHRRSSGIARGNALDDQIPMILEEIVNRQIRQRAIIPLQISREFAAIENVRFWCSHNMNLEKGIRIGAVGKDGKSAARYIKLRSTAARGADKRLLRLAANRISSLADKISDEPQSYSPSI